MTYPAPLMIGAADRATVRDPRWVVTRLQYACSDAAKIGEIFATRLRSSGNQESYELSALHNGIQRVMDDLTKWGPTGDAFVQRLGDCGLPALTWSPLPSGVGFSGSPDRSLATADAVLLAQRWAGLFALTEVSLPFRYHGIRRWTGEVEGWQVEVWAIVDAEQHRLPPWFGRSIQPSEVC
jgi:hypothetical protein